MAGLIGVGRDTMNQAVGGFGAAAQLETQRNAFNSQMSAARSAQRAQMAGTGGGIGAAIGVAKLTGASTAAAGAGAGAGASTGLMASIGTVAVPLAIGVGAALILDSLFDIF